MKAIIKLLGLLFLWIFLNGCSGGYYSYSTYPDRYYPSPYYAPFPSTYYRGFYPGYVYPYSAPYQSRPNTPSMAPSHPANQGTGMPGRRR